MEGKLISARELADLVVSTLNLEDVNSASVDTAEPLFGGVLDLDSLDMLEIALLMQQQFGVILRADDPEAESIFSTLETLADYINEQVASSAATSSA